MVFLIPISVISLFLNTKQPMTADVPATTQYENQAEADMGALTTAGDESSAVVTSEEAFDSEPEIVPEMKFDAVYEKHHIIQAGDTLSSIARKYNTSVEAIISENNLQNHLIFIGQILKIPPDRGIDQKSG